MGTPKQDPLRLRILRMYQALGLTQTELQSLRIEHVSAPGFRSLSIDFNQGRSPADLELAAYSLIANIASIKDHLKAWCSAKGVAFSGDALIDSNRSVALVHDLWNIDKHESLSRPPRSGHVPALKELRQGLQLRSNGTAGSGATFKFDPSTGHAQTFSVAGGSAGLVVDAQIVDEHGDVLGDPPGRLPGSH